MGTRGRTPVVSDLSSSRGDWDSVTGRISSLDGNRGSRHFVNRTWKPHDKVSRRRGPLRRLFGPQKLNRTNRETSNRLNGLVHLPICRTLDDTGKGTDVLSGTLPTSDGENLCNSPHYSYKPRRGSLFYTGTFSLSWSVSGTTTDQPTLVGGEDHKSEWSKPVNFTNTRTHRRTADSLSVVKTKY